MLGQTVHHYKILEKLGEGGMGVLYRALDTSLDRTVAIKFLRPEAVGSAERRQRFVREAKAASALNHPHIVIIHEIGRAVLEGVERDYIVMEYVAGKPFGQIIDGKPLGVDTTLRYAAQIADALSAAHEAGIVHRDIKPANLMVTDKGQVKVVDFGLAKLVERCEVDSSATTYSAGLQTQEGAVLGTAAYMSPEQAEGKPSDARSDVFSFGVVLYEMLTGRRPFGGDSHISIRMAILNHEPPPPKSLEKDVPSGLQGIVLRCLEKKKELRYSSATELADALQRFQIKQTSPAGKLKALLRKPRFAVPAGLALSAFIILSAWLVVNSTRARWARNVARPEIARLISDDDNVAAFRLARQAEIYLPDDPELQRLINACSIPVDIETNPSGAVVKVKQYVTPEDGWLRLGVTPLEKVRVPAGYLRWEIKKEGFETVEGAFHSWLTQSFDFSLSPADQSPAGMVRVASGSYPLPGGESAEIDAFWIDRYEVTNAEFKAFVDAGNYQKSDFWKEPFVTDGERISFDGAMLEHRDRTGRPGPSTWELGSYPEGEADFPVRGVSWYEAAAYCEFAGITLPTVYHWIVAGGKDVYSDILTFSNFSGQGPAPFGAHQGVSPFGSYDMAGNVAEWCSNATDERRYILGGSWNDPPHMFMSKNGLSPLDRSETNGFRCIKVDAALDPKLTAPIPNLIYDFSEIEPVDDEVFEIYKSLYAYDRTELNAAVDASDETSEHWRMEKVSFDAPYGNERVIAYLYLPRKTAPPYQVVLYSPGSSSLRLSSMEPELALVDFIPKSGRVLMFPVYQETYERRQGFYFEGPQAQRDIRIHWVKEIMRSLDYLETRPDIDHEKVAFLGLSMGARIGPIATALDERFKASVLLAGGFDLVDLRYPPEISQYNFASRVRVPTLMISGRFDFGRPYETGQIPALRLLGTPEEHKRLAVFDSGHLPPRVDCIRETLDWLDRYLGEVQVR